MMRKEWHCPLLNRGTFFTECYEIYCGLSWLIDEVGKTEQEATVVCESCPNNKYLFQDFYMGKTLEVAQ